MEEPVKFKLGITFAGAVTAGAYSAGVLYYLLRNLALWQKEKDNGNTGVPQHKVTIEIMGGASAGSMVAAIAALSFGRESADYQNDIQYKAWVELVDDPGLTEPLSPGSTLRKALKTGDNSNGAFSLLNADFLISLKQKVLNSLTQMDHPAPWPVYVSEHLQVLFTLTSLRHLPVGVRFSKNNITSNESPTHFMNLHEVVRYFMRKKPYGQDHAFKESLDPEDDKSRNTFIDTAVASGAFPVGFPPRILPFDGSRIHSYINNYFTDYKKKLDLSRIPTDDEITIPAIDGGTLNNEPFVEVQNLLDDLINEELKSKDDDVKPAPKNSEHTFEEVQVTKAEKKEQLEDRKKKHGLYDALIMIDPFPNFIDTDTAQAGSDAPKDIISGIINAIRGQAMIKNSDRLLKFIEGSRYGMIFPSRRKDSIRLKDKPALATGGVAAFAGFLSQDFRDHDFRLGMKNCQSFIRKYFGVPVTPDGHNDYFGSPSGGRKQLLPDSPVYQRFAYHDHGEIRLPIIPDMALEVPDPEEGEDARLARFNRLTEETKEMDFPAIDADALAKLPRLLFYRFLFLAVRWIPTLLSSSSAAAGKKNTLTEPYRLAIKVRRYFILIAVFVLLGILYYHIPVYTFWFVIIGLLSIVVVAILLELWNFTSRITASIIEELSSRDQIKS